MAFFNESNSASADRCSAKNNRRNEKSATATGAGKKSSGGFNFRRFFVPSCSLALLVVAIYMLLLEITPLDKKVMTQIQARNLSESNENGYFRKGNSYTNASSSDSESNYNLLSGYDTMDLGENEKEHDLDSHPTVGVKYADESDLYNVEMPVFNPPQMDLTKDMMKEKLNELINNMEEVPTKDDVANLWTLGYSLEEEEFYDFLIEIFEYYNELKETHNVDSEHANAQWSKLFFNLHDLLKQKEDYYVQLYLDFIMNSTFTKQECINIFNNCRKELADFRQQLLTISKSQLHENMVQEN
ncbi:hypothetical protein AK88_05571 [Plasmodium fragile]|uniref:Plasmodium RESA N-terminal domain-containing protein n=1 Tax=Plasmodium fragile TaxID=5857 RepID=A0A0D9QCU5_PLAFR|nr:uncharacterized protein AK88_05571 [Plasmodium fragile]KJP84799.1 hypothetical protein AK88_05571 [Plasmodium fragile]